MTELRECPWCGKAIVPQASDPGTAVLQWSLADDPRTWTLNPLECSECHGVGGYEDFAVIAPNRNDTEDDGTRWWPPVG